MKCANCDNDAEYLINDPGANEVGYCFNDVPRNRRRKAQAGEYPLPEKKAPAKVAEKAVEAS